MNIYFIILLLPLIHGNEIVDCISNDGRDLPKTAADCHKHNGNDFYCCNLITLEFKTNICYALRKHKSYKDYYRIQGISYDTVDCKFDLLPDESTIQQGDLCVNNRPFDEESCYYQSVGDFSCCFFDRETVVDEMQEFTRNIKEDVKKSCVYLNNSTLVVNKVALERGGFVCSSRLLSWVGSIIFILLFNL